MDFTEARKKIKEAKKLLSKGHPDLVNFWIGYLDIVLSNLYLEEHYPIVKASGKGILQHLQIPNLKNFYDVIEYCTVIYNPTHQVRFAVETINNIEEIRQLFNNESNTQIKHENSTQEES